MKVQEVLIDDRKRYLLIDGDNKPVVPVLKFLKYLDNIGKAENTLMSSSQDIWTTIPWDAPKEEKIEAVCQKLLAKNVKLCPTLVLYDQM